jgi:AraC-like DNA-binding protein
MLSRSVPKSFRGQHLTASNRLLWPVLEAVRRVRGEVATVLSAVGLDEETTYGADTRVTLEQLFGIWRAAVALTGDEALGVRLAMIANPATPVSWPMPLAMFEHLGLACSSLADAVGLQGRFIRLMRDGVRIQLELTGEQSVFRIEFGEDEPPALVEFGFAIALNIARRIAMRPLALHEVWFSHPAPAHGQEHAKLFEAPVRFGAPYSAMFSTAAEFTRPLPTANLRLRARLARQAEALLQALPSGELFEDRVCVQIETELPDGNTNASAVAEKLGVSARTLHRRLQQEGTSYQELLDRVRQRLAVQYLTAGKAIAEVAALVGFAQASTFHRAFKSWTGETPADYQTRRRAEVQSNGRPAVARGA